MNMDQYQKIPALSAGGDAKELLSPRQRAMLGVK